MPVTDILRVHQLEVLYDTSQVLFGLDLHLQKGETLALLGRNGAGKSTTMKAVAGMIASRGGDIVMQDRSIKHMPAHLIARAGLAYVPEDRQIFSELSVEDNLDIAYKLGPDGEDDWPIDRVYDMLPLLKPLRKRLGGLLSGGEQQMLTVGRALMGNPRVMLLDEPSEGLAPIMVQKIGDLIHALKATGTSIVLAEQNLHFCLGLADRAVVIDKGRDVFTGSTEALNADAQIKQRYLSV
jgi:branched-chain amino acid transport system ATP-binding protein